MVKTHFDLISGPFLAPVGLKRARFGPEKPFWGAPRSSEGPNGPNLVPTVLKWSDGIKIMVTTHFDLISGPFWARGGPKRARFGPEKPLLRPPWSLEGSGGPDLVPTAPEGPAEVKHMVTTHFDLISGPFWNPGVPKRARFGSERPFWRPQRSSEGRGESDLVPTAPNWPA